MYFKSAIILFLCSSIAYGQGPWQKNDYVTVVSHKNLDAGRFNSPRPITSLAIYYSEGDISTSSISVDGEVYQLSKDNHWEGELNSSNLLIFETPVISFEFNPGKLNLEEVEIHLIHSPVLAKRVAQKPDSVLCDEPYSIDQEDWRAGLPAPSYSRVFTATKHIIIHHAASSNSLTDYENVVRNIYLFHTQDRGWSDIGYNYVIAQDGTIFKGRDPGSGTQDLVRGAHFCGANSNTTGICILGNLSEVPVTEEARSSLIDLLNWKTLKDELDPLGTGSHSLNANLKIISGHRDGCSTECPGNLFYPELTDIRTYVNARNETCLNPPEPEPEEPVVQEINIGPNPVNELLSVYIPDPYFESNFELIDLQGKYVNVPFERFNDERVILNVSHLNPGLYLLSFKNDEQAFLTKVIVQ